MIGRFLSSWWLAVGCVLLVSVALSVPQSEAGKRKDSDRRAAKRVADTDREGAAKAKAKLLAPPEPLGPEILGLGEGSERFWVAFEDKRISIWANRMPADKLLEQLEAYGGPTSTCFEPLTRPVTLSLVRVRMEDVLRKMLDAYNFAYYYEDGRLAHVRILNYVPGRQYKATDPIVTRIDWTEDVLGAAHR